MTEQKLGMPTASVWGSSVVFSSATNIIQYLSLSFDGPSKWVFFGFIVYLILTIAIAVTAVFYNHLETHIRKNIHGFKKILAWTHLLGMNVGGTVKA